MTPSERLHLLGEGRLLQIQPTQVSDSGRYLCVATNVAGEDDQDFNVLIQGVWGPVGPGWSMGQWAWGAGPRGRPGVSVLLEPSGRWTAFQVVCSLSRCWLVCLTSRPLARALPFTDFVTWGHSCPPPGPCFYLYKM